MQIVPMTAAHAERVLAVYAEGIAEGDSTFETTVPAWAAFDAARLAGHRFVALDDNGEVLGWVAVSAVSSRAAYAGVVEHSVYVSRSARRLGVGLALLRALIESTEAAGIWTVQSGTFPENHGSRRLHQRAGFREVGVRERIGQRDGVWRDVILLERRSPVVN